MGHPPDQVAVPVPVSLHIGANRIDAMRLAAHRHVGGARRKHCQERKGHCLSWVVEGLPSDELIVAHGVAVVGLQEERFTIRHT
jgi:hypothetical protein